MHLLLLSLYFMNCLSFKNLTCCILVCRSFLSKTPVTNWTSPRIVTCGSRSAAKSRTRNRLIDKPVMTPVNGRSMRDRPAPLGTLPPTWTFPIELKTVDIWPGKITSCFHVISNWTKIWDWQQTLSEQRLNVVVVDLKRCITAAPCKSNNMIIVIADFDSDIAQRQIVSSDVEHSKDVSLHLESDTAADVDNSKEIFAIRNSIDNNIHDEIWIWGGECKAILTISNSK